MINEPFMAQQAPPQPKALNMDLENLYIDTNYAKRAKDTKNHERIHAKTFQAQKYIPQHKPRRPKKKKSLQPFQNFKADSKNAKATQNQAEAQEEDDAQLQYRKMIEGFSAQNGFDKEGNLVEESKTPVQKPKSAKRRPKTAALPRELAYKKALLRKMGKAEEPIGVSTLKDETKTTLKGVLSSKAPKRKQEVLIPKHKRVQRKLRPTREPEDSVEIGTKIEPTGMTLDTLPRFNKEMFKHWKPWLPEQKLPKWAADLQNDQDLKTLLTQDSKAGEEALIAQAMWWKRESKKRRQSCELPLAFYQKFKVKDAVISYASLKPRVEPRLQEIYRKFAVKLTEYEKELEANFKINGKFDPKETRDQLTKVKERQDRIEELKKHVEVEIDRVYSKKATKERQSVVFSKSKKQNAQMDTEIDTARLPGSALGMNEDLGDMLADTLEPPDQALPPPINGLADQEDEEDVGVKSLKSVESDDSDEIVESEPKAEVEGEAEQSDASLIEERDASSSSEAEDFNFTEDEEDDELIEAGDQAMPEPELDFVKDTMHGVDQDQEESKFTATTMAQDQQDSSFEMQEEASMSESEEDEVKSETPFVRQNTEPVLLSAGQQLVEGSEEQKHDLSSDFSLREEMSDSGTDNDQ